MVFGSSSKLKFQTLEKSEHLFHNMINRIINIRDSIVMEHIHCINGHIYHQTSAVNAVKLRHVSDNLTSTGTMCRHWTQVARRISRHNRKRSAILCITEYERTDASKKNLIKCTENGANVHRIKRLQKQSNKVQQRQTKTKAYNSLLCSTSRNTSCLR